MTLTTMREDYLKPDNESLNAAEKEVEKALRPLSFGDFTGQQKVVDNVKHDQVIRRVDGLPVQTLLHYPF